MSAPIEMLCNYCDDPKPTIRLIMLGGKRHAVNTDGSAHKHIKNALTQQQNQQKQNTPILVTQPVPKPGSYEADRQAAIQESHDENIAAYKEIAEAIRDLAAAIREKNNG
jgi:hypothetical protein